MATALSASVVIVGAGPVGLCLALDLVGRGIETLIAERNDYRRSRPQPKAHARTADEMAG